MILGISVSALDILTRLSGPAQFSRAPFGLDIQVFVHGLKKRGGTGLYVARDDRSAKSAEQIAHFMAPDLDVISLPGWDTLPFDRVSPSPAIAAKRCAGLSILAEPVRATRLIITTASSLVQRLPPIEVIRTASLAIKPEDTLSAERLTEYLTINGYVRTSVVRERGEYAIRGGLIDLFPPTEESPVRLDFFGDTLETLRSFDPDTQISTGSLKQLNLAPVSEILMHEESLTTFRTAYLTEFGPPAGDPLYEAARARIRQQGVEMWLPLFYPQMETLFDYIGEEALIGLGPLAQEAAFERLDQVADYYNTRQEAAQNSQKARVLAPGKLYLDTDVLKEAIATKSLACFHEGQHSGADLGGYPGRNFAPERLRAEINIFEACAGHVQEKRDSGKTVIFAAWSEGSAERLASVMQDHGLTAIPKVYSLEAALKVGLSVAELPLEAGFETDTLVFIAEQDVLGDKLANPRRKRKSANFIAEAAALSQGDLIVHADHGIGRYEGLKTLTLTGAAHDCLELEYAGGDKIYLPVENIDLISRYGSETEANVLDKLGGAGWQTRKAKTKKRILELASELMEIAAKRALRKGEAVHADPGLYEEFAARFPYEETEDQLSAIEDVIADLASGRPMDRLICGDVGFGKTEVALRAAFLCAMTGQQVAIIAPTTLLARQHYKTFTERLSGYPLNVRHLSRLVPSAEAREARAGLKDGQVDIVIGTHALLAKNIDMRRLGLMIVDEEQRFGVKHKERLKELKADIHVLTLSATPIPRTLQMSLTGIRDLSIIATPPVDRLSVRTYVSETDPLMLREALLREKYRGGQAFFVAPRIADIDKLESFLSENVPEVSYIVAHGQMAPSELEAIMNAFYEGEYDVLLSTTIVESGLDIPSANTLILHRADMFGLAQLYQLRGRVGRSKLRAYAYFTTPQNKTLTPSAAKRLRILQSLDSLGAGFELASHDLDMRGGGNLLGDQQSGHIREVGVELYQQMLEDAVNALKTGQEGFTEETWSPQMNLGVSVLIPEDYVEDLTVRMSLYRRLSDLETETDQQAFAAELIDRFGPIPEETRQLMEISALKSLCKKLGIAKLDAGEKGALVTFRDDTPLDPARLMLFIRARGGGVRLRPDSKLVMPGHWSSPQKRLAAIKKFVDELDGLAPEAQPA